MHRYILPELLGEIFKHVEHRADLAQYCLLSKACYSYAAPRVYEWVYIYTWHRNAKQRVSVVLQTLATSPRLASYVKALDFRDYPAHSTVDDKIQLVSLASQAISNCTKLRSCSWTRDGSLTTSIIESLAGLENLRSLEINGRPGQWTPWVPRDLLNFRRLHSLTLIMPTHSVIDVLPAWLTLNEGSLESLVIICQSTNVLNNENLCHMAPLLKQLRHLHLAGCIKITDTSIQEVIVNNAGGLQSLALESCSPYLNIDALATTCYDNKSLSLLVCISLTLPYRKSSAERGRWIDSVLVLLHHSPLESFQLYAGGGAGGEPHIQISPESIAKLVDGHAATLRRIGIQKLIISLESLAYATRMCPNLEELFVTLQNTDRDELTQALVSGKRLRNVHTTLMMELRGTLRPIHLAAAKDICSHIARQCGFWLRLIGTQTKVWKVVRRLEGDNVMVSLEAYSGPQIPEQFLMMRT